METWSKHRNVGYSQFINGYFDGPTVGTLAIMVVARLFNAYSLFC